MKFIPGLNGIRAIAVLMVIVSHRFPEHLIFNLPLGSFGVDIFFVLSGFLISRILFRQLKEFNSAGITRSKLILNFILRRMLRIFPIYYLTLLFLYITKGLIGNNYEDNILWYLFYGANFLTYYDNKWYGSLAHLWSLSVEEQFYLIWPFLLFYLLKTKILFVLIFIIIFGTIYPFFFTGKADVLTLACINAFGLGALLAYFEILNPDYEKIFLKILNFLIIPILLTIIINYTVFDIPYFSRRLAISLFAVTIIAYCRYYPSNKIIRYILVNRFLSFIGMISYGIYLYHNLIPKYWRYGFSQIGIDISPDFSYLNFFSQTSVIILISYISWILIEKPILKLKKFF